MRATEQAAIASGSVTGLDLMERAGRGVVDAVFDEWPELAATAHRAVVLCGPGNNGGDGFVVARLLRAWGWEVAVCLYGDAAKLPSDAKVNYERWCEMGAVSTNPPAKTDADLIVDALFGTGLTRALDGAAQDWLVSVGTARVVALDLPSGVCSDSGKVLGSGAGARADLTVTFHSLKPGHLLAAGPDRSGKVVIADIGLAGCPTPPREIAHCINGPTPGISKFAGAHKYTHGHALILAGPATKTGAARLAARGALRIGAGLVTVGAPTDALAECAAHLTAVMLTGVQDGDALAHVLRDDRINALCLGPGLGVERAADLVAVALGHSHPGQGNGAPEVPDQVRDVQHTRACVLDADALSAFGDDPASLFAMLHATCVLTPHAGEFARLFPDIAEKLNAPAITGPAYSKVDATRDAAKRAGCVVLFKGADTVIADPDGRCVVNSATCARAAPWLATAGSGDVLAGFITGLLARGFGAMQAAQAAAWLHVECALSFGPGLIAEDVPEELPKVFRGLGL
ncbi:NAD(P)H-hydrate dehydratase [Octadecabacter sp. R77987]|uniref:NAD(P)H-hydrate dehydratase n=1 Tax=Octadecabacter sp. R77987 TaxID=3093874 RepID=UPI00366F6604